MKLMYWYWGIIRMVKRVKKQKVKKRELKIENGHIVGWHPTDKPVDMTTVFPFDFPGFKQICEEGFRDKNKNLQFKAGMAGDKFIKVGVV